ncbi:MAG: helix-turn-helix domain-containing protein [Candidatus Woesearchaeota archaeon]
MQILEEAGLTKNEIAVYKSLLQLGSTTAGPLTKKSQLHRSRVYESLNRLIDKGIVSYKIKANRKYFQAQNPETLLDFLEEKKQKIRDILPELKALQEFHPETQEANVFEGYKGLKSIFDNALNQSKKGDEILVFGARAGKDSAPETWKAFFKNFNKRRIQKGIKYKIIFNQELKNTEIPKEFQKSPLTQVRFIKQKTIAGINIHSNIVAIIVWKKKPYAFVITSKEVNESFKEYFNVMWKQAKK